MPSEKVPICCKAQHGTAETRDRAAGDHRQRPHAERPRAGGKGGGRVLADRAQGEPELGTQQHQVDRNGQQQSQIGERRSRKQDRADPREIGEDRNRPGGQQRNLDHRGLPAADEAAQEKLVRPIARILAASPVTI